MNWDSLLRATDLNERPDVLLSVVIPHFNHGKYLEAAIDALLRQDLRPDEIIILDDGSTDGSRPLLEAMARRHHEIVVVFNALNRGVIATLNAGLAMARGRYVFFAAADDWTEPTLFSTSLRHLEAFPEAALFCAEARLVDQEGRQIGVRPAARPSDVVRFFSAAETRDLLRTIDHFIVTLTAVFRRDRLVAAGGFDPALRSLADGFVARNLAVTSGFVFSPTLLATWRINPAGVSRSDASSVSAASEILEKVIARLRGDRAYPPGYVRLFERRWRYATGRLALKAGDIDFVRAFTCTNGLDRAVVDGLRRLPLVPHLTMLIWLTLRLRPFSLTRLFTTAFGRFKSRW